MKQFDMHVKATMYGCIVFDKAASIDVALVLHQQGHLLCIDVDGGATANAVTGIELVAGYGKNLCICSQLNTTTPSTVNNKMHHFCG